MEYNNKGIPLSTGFDLNAKKPIDSRLIKNTRAEMEAISDISRYEGMSVFVIDEWVLYRLSADNTWIPESFSFKADHGTPDINLGYIGWMYLDIDSGEIYSKELDENNMIAWVYKYSITPLVGPKGDKGDTGVRGSQWFTGTAISGGVNIGEKIFTTSGITMAYVNDQYLNTDEGMVYSCTVTGGTTQAKWKYKCSIRGIPGVVIQDDKPSDPNVSVWVRTNMITENGDIVPFIKDDVPSNEDTYSSAKINEIIGGKWYFGNIIGSPFTKAGVDYDVYHIADNQLIDVHIGDIYFHRNNYTVYQCIAAGNKDIAEWVIKTNLMNPILQVIRDQGYMKAVSVTELPANPETDTIYFIQGEVTIV